MEMLIWLRKEINFHRKILTKQVDMRRWSIVVFTEKMKIIKSQNNSNIHSRIMGKVFSNKSLTWVEESRTTKVVRIIKRKMTSKIKATKSKHKESMIMLNSFSRVKTKNWTWLMHFMIHLWRRRSIQTNRRGIIRKMHILMWLIGLLLSGKVINH